MSDLVSFPFSALLKLVISEAKKVKEFQDSLKELVWLMEMLLPILKEIDSLQERLDPCNGELNILMETMRKAEKLVRKCSRVRWYQLFVRSSCKKEIKQVNGDFYKICQLLLPLIQLKKSLQQQKSPPQLGENSTPPYDAIWESFKEKCKEIQIKAGGLFAAVFHNILYMEESLTPPHKESSNTSNTASPLGEDKKLVVANHQETRESKEEISWPEDQDVINSAIQASILSFKQEKNLAKKRARELRNGAEMSNGSSSSTTAHEEEQRIIMESLKEKYKGKRVMVDKDESVKNFSLREAEAKYKEYLDMALRDSKEDERKRNRALKKKSEAEELTPAFQKTILLSVQDKSLAKKRAREFRA